MALYKKIFHAEVVAVALLSCLAALPLSAEEAHSAHDGHDHPAPTVEPGLVRPNIAASRLTPEEFGKQIILDGGRLKPVDTVARAALMRFGGRWQAVNAETKKRVSATVWLYSLVTAQPGIDDWAVFRVDHPELKSLLGDAEAKFFSYAQLVGALPTLAGIASAAPTEEQKQDPYERQAIALVKNIGHYFELKDGLSTMGLLNAAYKPASADQKTRAGYEHFYNTLNPLLTAEVLYVLALVTLLLSAIWPRLRRVSVLCLSVALALQLFGVVSRMYIQERPPVTNLYSSAIFVGAIAVVGAFLIERGLKSGLGLAFGAIMGFISLQIADKLAESGDTLEMMRAVLDSNFWLATHVVVVTIGYSAMFLAGGVAWLALIKSALGRLSEDELRRTGTVVYGTVCVALLFSFVGTMLGGIWADQSWGRFWGWDPKENGALMIVLWSALILHARWGGVVGPRGVLALAVGGNIITAWSWFGTNMLGVGLHSYGFTTAAFWSLAAFVLLQLAGIILGLLFGLKAKPKPDNVA